MVKKKISKQPKHIQDIPIKYFPRKSKAKEYSQDLIRTVAALDYTNRKVQYSAQICIFNIKSIMQKRGFAPKSTDVFNEIQDFVYHYENFCYRMYTFREKLIQFINAIIPLGYTDKEVRIRDILVSPLVKEAGLLPIVELFSKNTALSKAIKDRTKMTHRLYYGEEFDHYLRPQVKVKPKEDEEIKSWFTEWKKQIISRSENANKSREMLDNINHTLTQKVTDYKKKRTK